MAGSNTLSDGLREVNAKELESVELAAGDTTTSSTGISSVQAEQWMEQVVRDAEAMRRFQDVSREFTDLVDSGDDTLHIPKTTGHLDVSATGVSEGTDRTFTQLDNLTTVDVTISSDNWYKGGIAIAKEALLTTSVDLVSEAENAVAEEMAQDVDVELRDEAVSSASNNVDQSTSGELTPDSISQAMQNIESNDYSPEFLVISPAHQHDLRTDSQFTNASEYGNREVVANGEIGTYLGVRVVVSSNVGDYAVMMGQTRTGEMVGTALVWKEEPNMAMEYNRESAEQRIYYDQAFEVTTVQPDAVCTIQTA